MKIILLDKSYKQQVLKLYDDVINNLENELWFLPRTQNEVDSFFDKNHCCMVGIEEGQIVASSVLHLDNKIFNDVLTVLDIENKNVAELGRCVVAPSFRGNNLMFKLNKKLLELAKSLGIKKIVATAHPDNIAINKSLIKLGMKNVKTMLRDNNYLRNVYLLELK